MSQFPNAALEALADAVTDAFLVIPPTIFSLVGPRPETWALRAPSMPTVR